MHLPDHYLDPSMCATTVVAAAGALTWSAVHWRRSPQPVLATMAATTAGIFAAQMVNYPVAHGTSGHLVGGTLAAILLGPWPAMLAMSVVLVVQCFLFGDGGVAALGANLLNMAVISPLVGWALYRVISQESPSALRRNSAAAAAAWVAVMAGAAACAIELGISGAHSLGQTLWAMGSMHALIGVSEAFITAAVTALVLRWVSSEAHSGALLTHESLRNTRHVAWLGLALAAAIVVVLSPWASTLPDGLESVAEQLGFASSSAAISLAAPISDYVFPGIGSPLMATVLAGLLGVAVCAAGMWFTGRAMELTSRTSRRGRWG